MFICTQVAALRARDAALQQALAERNIDNVELRRQLAAARQAADPHVAQARPPAACIHLRRLISIALAAALSDTIQQIALFFGGFRTVLS